MRTKFVAGFVTVTVTPGMTAPVGSCMTPLMLACVWATAGRTLRKTINQIDQIRRLRIVPPFLGVGISRSSLPKLLPDENNFARSGRGAHPIPAFQKSGVRFISELQLERELDLPRGWLRFRGQKDRHLSSSRSWFR